MIYKLKEGFILRKLGDSIMAVPVGQQTSEIHGVIALSESGELLWKELENGADIASLVKVLTDTYEVDETTALSDVKRFVDDLKVQGALI